MVAVEPELAQVSHLFDAVREQFELVVAEIKLNERLDAAQRVRDGHQQVLAALQDLKIHQSARRRFI